MARFAIWSIVTLAVLCVALVAVSHQVARSRALVEAREQTRRLSDLVVAPLVDRKVRQGDPKALAPLARVLETSIKVGALRHVKLWSKDGQIIWSDEERLIGRTFELPDDVAALFGTHRVTAEVSELNKAENVGERGEGELLEVYAGTVDRDGAPLVFEAYLAADRIARDERAIIVGTLPTAIGGLLLLQLAVLPLALALARRVRSSEAARSRMTSHALRAADLEQQRLAQELHDGVVQDLAGVAFTLPTLRRELPDTPEGRRAADTLELMRGIVADDVLALRTMMIEIYPPDLATAGLVASVKVLAARGRDLHGVDVRTTFVGDLELPLKVSRLAYRVVREGLHNVYKHSGAQSAEVTVERRGRTLHVVVTDTGRGLQVPLDEVGGDHLGLRLLSEAVQDVGGALALTPDRPGSVGTGTGVRLEVRLPIVSD